MKISMRILPLILLFLLCLPGGILFAETEPNHGQAADRPPCSDCHVCSKPTTKAPCLEECMRIDKVTKSSHKSDEGPSMMSLSQLEESYGPVEFNHELHAQMVGMGEGCRTCHHYSPKGKVPPCSECHSAHPTEEESLKKPGLKGAYHRQCMGCHREWSHDTKCVVCHLPSDKIDLASASSDATDIVGIPHPVITVPHKEVYHTSFEKGPVVTFYHSEHVELFDIRCVDCHKKESCDNCHDINPGTRNRKTVDEVHEICSDCHQDAICGDCPTTDACFKCHDTSIKPAFKHKTTDWKLSRFHQGLACRNCHPTGRAISTLKADCNSCHAGWNQDNFRHAVTGLNLDEAHESFECEDCHINLQYHQQHSCENCHDDDKNYRKTPPGNYVR